MRSSSHFVVRAALIAALYVLLTHLQNLILPDTTSMAIQFRASEALCVLAFFTPGAIAGLSIGCLLFNLSFSAALPLDVLVGTLATVLACSGMYLTRRITVKGLPLPGLLLPAVCNGILVGWELDFYIGGGFWFNAACVAVGEAVVLLSLGSLLFYVLKSRNLDRRLFS